MSLIITSLKYSYEYSVLIPQMSIKAIIIVVLKVSLVIDNRVKVISKMIILIDMLTVISFSRTEIP